MADREKLIEMLKTIYKEYSVSPSDDLIANYLISHGVTVKEKGEWEFFVETSFNGEITEADDCGWRCSHCKKPLEEVVGGYWDDDTSIPTLNYCPNCGAKMERNITDGET